MRDLVLFALCCCLAAAFWVSRDRGAQESRSERQAELYQLGAPQSMEESPERWLLLGDFAKGLRSHPSPDTYRKLASLYLVSADLEGRTVKTTAYNAEGMARVAGKALELFDPQGRQAAPELWRLGDKITPYGKPLFEVAAKPELETEGAWIRYSDAARWAVFRWDGDVLRGYLSDKEIILEGDAMVVGKLRWTWVELQDV